jgi:hypothetical protein
MAWRIDEHLIRGEIDNRTRGRVSGTLWFAGRAEPVVLALTGNAWRDLAGHVLRITNPEPKPAPQGALDGFVTRQDGVAGDITASRKVRVPECSMDELMDYYEAKKPFPWHWGNSLYLEWHGERNGRVVIESAAYQLEIVGEATWTMDEGEERRQREANGQAVNAFMERLESALNLGLDEAPTAASADAEDDEASTSKAEAAADAEQARMDLLLDRVNARMLRELEAGGTPDLERVMDEERARLRRERGEPEPTPLTPEEEAERAAWAEEMHAVAGDALEELESEPWMSADEDRDHPLVERCSALTERLLRETEARGWLTDDDESEHPLREVVNGVMFAGPKLAGALNMSADEDWPPPPLYAGNTLTRLKTARGHLRDALAGLADAAEQGLAAPVWLALVRAEVVKLVAEVETLIAEVRAVLKDAEDWDAD